MMVTDNEGFWYPFLGGDVPDLPTILEMLNRGELGFTSQLHPHLLTLLQADIEKFFPTITSQTIKFALDMLRTEFPRLFADKRYNKILHNLRDELLPLLATLEHFQYFHNVGDGREKRRYVFRRISDSQPEGMAHLPSLALLILLPYERRFLRQCRVAWKQKFQICFYCRKTDDVLFIVSDPTGWFAGVYFVISADNPALQGLI